jgi:hypothetical protein
MSPAQQISARVMRPVAQMRMRLSPNRRAQLCKVARGTLTEATARTRQENDLPSMFLLVILFWLKQACADSRHMVGKRSFADFTRLRTHGRKCVPADPDCH